MIKINNLPIKRIYLALGFCAIIAVSCVAYYFLIGLKSVKILPENGVTITLTAQQDRKLITQTDQSQTIRVKSGDYIVNYSAGEDYEEQSKTISINSSLTITAPQLDYSSSKLASILTSEASAIQALLASISNINEYNVSKENLYIRGEWYGAVLIPNAWYDTTNENEHGYPPNPNNTLDVVRIIANKSDDKWQIVAGPSIVFYIDDYPNIPEEVIRDANALGNGQ